MLFKKIISATLSLGMVMAMLVAPTAKAESVNVAQGKTLLNADGTICTTMGNLVDGSTSNHTHDANLKEVIVDLGKRYKIDKISRDQQCGWQMVGIYVSNDINGEWKQLLRGNYQGNVLNVTNIDGAYRYVKLTAEGDWAHICTHELYVYAEETNGPALLDASQENGVVTLDFNDTLAEGTISGISVKDASGNPVSADMSLSADKYSVTFNVPANKDWQVTIPSTVTNESGTSFPATTINIALKDVYAGLDHKTISSFNIAKGAKLYNAEGTECTTMGNLVDGNTSTNTHDANCKEVIVDLGRRCKIDKISRNQLCGWQLVGIYVSNDINGEWKQLKYGNFQGNVVAVEDIDGLYRYVKLTASDHICTSELYVHTTMDVTEVSRNKTATASGVIDSTFTAQKAVNGTNSSHNDGWMGPYGKYSWWKLDFGENNPQNIGYVEIESRISTYSDIDGRRNFALYGANGDVTTDDTSADITGADKLASLDTSAFPAYSSSTPDTTKYQQAINETQGYRYLIYKKTVAGPAEIGEFRAYVINPRVLSMTKDDNNVVTATFDSDIFAESIDGNITVTSGEEVVAISNVNVTDNVVTFTVVDPPEGDLTVTIDRFVRNLKSVPMAEEYTKVFVAPVVKVSSVTFDGTVTADGTVKATAVLESTLSEDKTVELIIAVKDSSGRLKLANLDRQTITAGGELTLETSITLPADVTGLEVEAFVWESETLEPLMDKVNL